MKLTVLTGADVRRLVPMSDAIDAMAVAFSQVSSGAARIPLRTPVESDHGLALFMPGYLADSRVLGGKVVTVFGGNAAAGLPVVNAVVLLVDPTNGMPRALMDGTVLTALRTGAASGLATRLLARENASVLAVFGAGVQARTQIEAVRAVRPIREVRIVSVPRATAEVLAAELEAAPDGPEMVRVLDDPTAAVDGAHVIVTATTSSTPVFPGEAVSPGAHVNAIGAYTPEMREVDDALIVRATVIVDAKDGALAEAGDVIIPLREGLVTEEAVSHELGDVVSGRHPGRTRDDEITFFKSVGNAAQDLEVAARALAAAERTGGGQVVDV